MLTLNFEIFPKIATEQLNLSRLRLEDAEDIYIFRKKIDDEKLLDNPYFTRTLQEVVDNLKQLEVGVNAGELIVWGITPKDSDKVIGTLGFHKIQRANYRAEIGYMISPQYWGSGAMSEGIKAILKYGFDEMNLNSIEANVSPENMKSINLLNKFHFIKEGYLKENYLLNGKFSDTVVYSLLRKNYYGK